jgi:hypothetical protein
MFDTPASHGPAPPEKPRAPRRASLTAILAAIQTFCGLCLRDLNDCFLETLLAEKRQGYIGRADIFLLMLRRPFP